MIEIALACAAFSGIRIVAFSVHPTSFDLIVDSPRAIHLSREEMLVRLEKITAPAPFELNRKEPETNDSAVWARLSARFGDVSSFLKQLKLLVTKLYHRGYGTNGSLWNSRFSSAYLQTGHASRILSVWLDHAAVRDGETQCADDDKSSTFGRVVSRDKRARAMIEKLYGPENGSASWRKIARAYRAFVTDDTPQKTAHRVIKGIPLLTRAQLFLTEVPHFRGGLAIGDKAFVESFFQLNRHEFGPKRSRGGHLLTGQNDPDLWTIRQKTDLRKI